MPKQKTLALEHAKFDSIKALTKGMRAEGYDITYAQAVNVVQWFDQNAIRINNFSQIYDAVASRNRRKVKSLDSKTNDINQSWFEINGKIFLSVHGAFEYIHALAKKNGNGLTPAIMLKHLWTHDNDVTIEDSDDALVFTSYGGSTYFVGTENGDWTVHYNKYGYCISLPEYKKRARNGDVGTRLIRPTPNMYRPMQPFFALEPLLQRAKVDDFDNQIAVTNDGVISFIVGIERGYCEPTNKDKIKIAQSLGLTVEALWVGETEMEPVAEPETVPDTHVDSLDLSHLSFMQRLKLLFTKRL